MFKGVKQNIIYYWSTYFMRFHFKLFNIFGYDVYIYPFWWGWGTKEWNYYVYWFVVVVYHV